MHALRIGNALCGPRPTLLPFPTAPSPYLCILPQRQATLAYIEALQQLDPPVTSSAMYEDVAGRLQDSEAFEPLDERKRRQVFGTYIGGLRRWVADSCWGGVGWLIAAGGWWVISRVGERARGCRAC